MNIKVWFIAAVALVMICVGAESGRASEPVSDLEKNMSETLDTWRDGQYEQLFEQLVHRGKTSKEAFVKKMRETTTRPACCWQKMENFKVLNEKSSTATVYVKVGLEGTPGGADSITREFKLTHQEGVWKMQLADVYAIAGVSGKKSGPKRHSQKRLPYHF